MRKNFAQILKSGKVDYKKEYEKLYDMLFAKTIAGDNGKKQSLYDIFDKKFTTYWFHGTCLSLQEFDEKNGFAFPDPKEKEPELDDLVLLMEYFYNMLAGYQPLYSFFVDDRVGVVFLMQHIQKVCDAIGYKVEHVDGFTVFLKNDAVVTAVAESEMIPDDLSYRLIMYDHHSMNLESKKAIILRLSQLLESKRKKLGQVNPGLENSLFYAFNNFNLRHNNCDSSAATYKPVIAQMDEKELGAWYDEIYQMCLLAFMELEQAERKPRFDKIKAEIEAK